MPVEEYPTLPQVEDQTGVLPAEEFSSAVAQVAVAASRDDVTPVITGVQLEVGENNLSLVATDRYRPAAESAPACNPAARPELRAIPDRRSAGFC